MATADAQIWLGVQIETRAGLAALDAICATEGVDGVFVGPSDLAADMGHPGDSGHADVQEAIRDAIRRIAASGKAPGIIWTDPALIRTALTDGARFVATAVDVITYAEAIRAAAAAGQAMKG